MIIESPHFMKGGEGTKSPEMDFDCPGIKCQKLENLQNSKFCPKSDEENDKLDVESFSGTETTCERGCGGKSFLAKTRRFFSLKKFTQNTGNGLSGTTRESPLAPDTQPKNSRGQWSGKADFLMSLIAYAVGLGNVWRFPYVSYKNGGGAFLIPYFVCWLVAAMPIFFMEVSIGQFLGEGGISVWKLCPIFKGVGIANTFIAIFCNIYFPVIVAWAIFYVISTFTTSPQLPWQTCSRSWNDEFCWDPKFLQNNGTGAQNFSSFFSNNTQSPVTQFWEKRVLQTSANIDEMGSVQFELLGILAFVWLLTYFALYKGIINSRKVVYVCAITPYILLLILLVNGLTLDGAMEGIKFYLKPDLNKLMKVQVWKDAGTQIFYSTGIGFGTLVALGSYNHYNHNVYRDSLILCVVNSMTSLIAGFVVFSVLGYMAKLAGKTVDQVVKSDVGLAFLVYPEAVSTLPVSQLWSVLFFLMIVILGLDSLVCMVEGVVLALCDQFPDTLRKHKKRFLAVLCFVGFLCGVPMVCQNGQFWLTLVDSYGASGMSLLFVVFFEIIGLSWVFGARKISRALEDMLHSRPSFLWTFAWKYTAPVTCTIIFVITVCNYSPLMYPDQVTPYPSWAMVLGLLMSSVSMLAIPAYAIFYLCTTPGSLKQRLLKGTSPSIDLTRIEKNSKNNAIPIMDKKSPMCVANANQFVNDELYDPIAQANILNQHQSMTRQLAFGQVGPDDRYRAPDFYSDQWANMLAKTLTFFVLFLVLTLILWKLMRKSA